MNADLHGFIRRYVGTVVLTLVPVIFTAFVSMPLAVNRHPGEPATPSLVAVAKHMT